MKGDRNKRKSPNCNKINPRNERKQEKDRLRAEMDSDQQQEHEVYGGEIPDGGEMEADIDIGREEEYDDAENPNTKEVFFNVFSVTL